MDDTENSVDEKANDQVRVKAAPTSIACQRGEEKTAADAP
jgi:hypothetical protein